MNLEVEENKTNTQEDNSSKSQPKASNIENNTDKNLDKTNDDQ